MAIGISLTALAGWSLNAPALMGFGIARYPEWPITAISLAAVGLSSIAIDAGNRPASFTLLTLPMFVALLALGAYVLGASSPLDGLLIPTGSVADLPHRGRPSVGEAVSLLILGGSIILADARGETHRLAAQNLAAAALGLSALSACVDLLQLGIATQTMRLPASIPASCAAGLIALGLMSRQPIVAAPRALLPLPAGRNFAALTLLAVIPALILPIVEQLGHRADLSALEFLFVASCLYLLLALVVWAWIEGTSRRDRQALEDLVGAFNALPVILVGPDGRVRHWSEGCETVFGRLAIDANGRPLSAVIPGFGASQLQYDHLTGDGLAPGLHQLETQNIEGGRLSLIARTEPIETSTGRLLAIALSDTGTLAETRAALARSETALEIALEANDIAVFDWNVVSGNLVWLASAEERLGLGPGEMRDFDSWQALIAPEDRGNVKDSITKAVEGKAARVGFRYRLATYRGGARTIEGTGHLFYGTNGQLVRCVAVNIDVTERERREMALISSEAQLRAIVETVPDAMIVINEQGRIQSLSTAAERLFRVDANAMVGKMISTLMPEPWFGDQDRSPEAGDHRLAGRRRELFAKRSDGSDVPVELSVGEAWVGNRRLFVGFIRDISPRIQAEQRLEELNAAYAHSARLNAVGELAASLAHELNQPLAASSNFLAAAEALLERSEGKSQVTDFLNQAGDQILRAGEIIRRLRDFIAKADAEMQIVPLAPVLQEAVELGLTGNRQLRIETIYDFDPAVPSFLGDRIQVEQVIVNLVRNAAQALRAQPLGERTIHVTTRRDSSEMVRVSVTDNGPGIPETVLDRLAVPFLTTKGDEGLGLGISICRRIVDAHGGTFSAGNSDDSGARFEFTLPVGEIDSLKDEP